MIELARIERAVLIERPGRTQQRLADEAREGEHAEAVAHLAERIAAGERAS
jgi:hypothetical protein